MFDSDIEFGSSDEETPIVVKPWGSGDVLTTHSFPSTQILRRQKNSRAPKSACACTGGENHRNFFDFCKVVVRPNFCEGIEIPEDIAVCWNARSLFNTALPRELIATKNGDRVLLSDLPTIGDVVYALRKGTYWFARAAYYGSSVRNCLTPTGRHLILLLAGVSSTSGNFNRAGSFLAEKTNPKGIKALRNILATIDGMLMQICLCFPGEDFLNWKRVDAIIHCLLRNLVPDYTRHRTKVEVESSFEKIKRIRKAIKKAGFDMDGDVGSVPVPRELSFLRRVLQRIGTGQAPIDIYRVSILCQTRASGVPPMTVYEKTFSKIKETLQTPSSREQYEKIAPYINHTVDKIHAEYCGGKSADHLSEIMHRVQRCAKISLSDSAEMFTTLKEGGKLEAAREVLARHKEVDEISLINGSKTGKVLDSTNSNEGERLFHWALAQFDLSNPKAVYDRNIMSVRLSLIAEMGKWRGVSVAHLAHAVVLHPLSHVTLEYLREHPSARSGVGAANHAWNFFKRLSLQNPAGAFVLGDEDIWLFSTDWETASDKANSLITAHTLNKVCRVTGIPEHYRRVCVFALAQPRQVEFKDPEDKTLCRFFTQSGTLMGDPCTKTIMQWLHLIADKAAEELAQRSAR